MEFKLNPDLDLDALGEAYAVKKRLQIKQILPTKAAKHINELMDKQTPWIFTFSDGSGTNYMPIPMLRSLPPQENARLQQMINQTSRNGFGFCYNTFNFHNEIMKGNFLDHPIKKFDDFLQSDKFLGFIRKVTGDETIDGCGAAATWFGPGHYLNIHSDQIKGCDLRAAFIFNFSPKWRADWGGELKFFPDKEGSKVEEGLFPAYNVLNIATVPYYHSVGVVAPFAGAPRFSISGWLFSGKPPPLH